MPPRQARACTGSIATSAPPRRCSAPSRRCSGRACRKRPSSIRVSASIRCRRADARPTTTSKWMASRWSRSPPGTCRTRQARRRTRAAHCLRPAAPKPSCACCARAPRARPPCMAGTDASRWRHATSRCWCRPIARRASCRTRWPHAGSPVPPSARRACSARRKRATWASSSRHSRAATSRACARRSPRACSASMRRAWPNSPTRHMPRCGRPSSSGSTACTGCGSSTACSPCSSGCSKQRQRPCSTALVASGA